MTFLEKSKLNTVLIKIKTEILYLESNNFLSERGRERIIVISENHKKDIAENHSYMYAFDCCTFYFNNFNVMPLFYHRRTCSFNQMGRYTSKLTWFPNMSDTNHAVQAQEIASAWKFEFFDIKSS